MASKWEGTALGNNDHSHEEINHWVEDISSEGKALDLDDGSDNGTRPGSAYGHKLRMDNGNKNDRVIGAPCMKRRWYTRKIF